jgi:nitrate/nitrite-specific signal transduction histidine kinase
MKIRTQFILSMIVLGSLLLLVSIAVVITDQKVENTSQQELLASQIESEAHNLSTIANDYLLYRESQQASRWESQFASFSNDLSEMKVTNPEQQALLADIKTNQQQLRAIFTEIKAGIENAPQTQEAAFDTTFMQVSWSRLEVQHQAMIFDASRLRQMLSEQDDQWRRGMSLLSFVLIGVFGVILLGNYWVTYQRTLKAMAVLQAGTKIIGSGKLDYAIPVKRQDEIGELSQAFNQMAANLKDVTASKTDLEKEIIERKQAEAALQASEAEIQRNVEALRSANTELSQFNRAMIGRELRMVELKKEVDELCRQAGQPERYFQSNGGEAA